MDFKEILSYWKIVLTFAVVIVTTTVSVISWAEDQKVLIKAEQQLIHNTLYQESRIERRRDQIQDNIKLIRAIESSENLSETQREYVEYLQEEIVRLTQEIEEIRARLITND